MDIYLPRRSKSQDKKNKNRKYGRNGRRAKHRVNQLCGMSNCNRLQESRVYSEKLGAYVTRQGLV